MKRFGITCAALTVLAGPAFGQAYILAGQSNMSGRGAVQDLTPAERTPDPTIRLFGNDGQWRAAAEPLDDATGQADEVSADRLAAVGPGLFFARRMGGPVDLIPCAKGGSSIGRWKPAPGRDTLYGSCLGRVKESGASVAGVLWYQGETDAERPDAGPAWRAAFYALVVSLRQDLGSARTPIVVVQLADPPTQRDGGRPYPSWSAIQAAQAEPLPACVVMVQAKGLPKLPDDLHLDTAAQRELGSRIAEAMQALQREGCR